MEPGDEMTAMEGAARPAGGRVLLLVPARTYRAADFLTAAAQVGADLVIASDGALPLGGLPVVRADPGDPDRSASRLVAAAGQVDAVVAADTPMLALAAAVAARLGLPHNPVEAVVAATDKTQQRRRWADAGIAQPAFRILPADGPAAAVAAAGRIRQILATAGRPGNESLLIEEYVPGWELSIDGLLEGGDLTVTAVFDKPGTPEGPTFEETVLITPARLPGSLLAAAVRTAGQAARALRLRYGPIHAELRIDDRRGQVRPVMLELAARSIGGLCSRALRFGGGQSLEELVLASALGRRVSPRRLPGTSGVLMLPIERAGVLQAVEGRAEAAAVPGITGLTITIPSGQPVHPLPEGDRYLGFVFAEGEDYQQVERALANARQRLRVVIH